MRIPGWSGSAELWSSGHTIPDARLSHLQIGERHAVRSILILASTSNRTRLEDLAWQKEVALPLDQRMHILGHLQVIPRFLELRQEIAAA